MAKIYLLDSDIYSFLSENHPEVEAHLKSVSDADEIFICFATVGEWEYGYHNAKSAKSKAEIRVSGNEAFDRLSGVIQSSQDINNIYGQIRSELKNAGTMIPLNDVWIAAAALAIGATLVTHDQHFRHVQNLAVVDWTKEKEA